MSITEEIIQTLLALGAVTCFALAYLIGRARKDSARHREYLERLRIRADRAPEDLGYALLLAIMRTLEDVDDLENDHEPALFIHMN